MRIRKANPEDADVLTALSMRSKAHWGYDAAFMEACRESLRVPKDAIEKYLTYVVEDGDRVAGFFMLTEEEGCGHYLESMFVDPDFIGRGMGRLIWDKLIEVAKVEGIHEFILDADPHAEGFYQHMGAVRIGEHESSTFPGRMLPRMKVTL